MNEIKIHDIKPLVEINDYSLYIYMLLWILAVLFFLALIFLVYRFFKNRKNNQRKEYYKILKELDLNDSKNSAYAITKYGRLLARNEREIKIFEELNEELEAFKYKKEVEALNSNVKIHFGRFMDIIDV